jgi:hypothetical protein
MVDVVLSEILAVPAARSRGRHNPRAVKRKMSNFPTKSRAVPDPLPSQRIHYEDHIRIVAPVVPPDPAEIGRQQIQPWQASGLPRTEYCERHGLPPRTLQQVDCKTASRPPSERAKLRAISLRQRYCV